MVESSPESESQGFPTKEELLVLADYWEERGDSRAEFVRNWGYSPESYALLVLLPEPDLSEAVCAFVERALGRERNAGRDPNHDAWKAVHAKQAWLRGEIDEDELARARVEANAAIQPLTDSLGRTQHPSVEMAIVTAARAAPFAAYLPDNDFPTDPVLRFLTEGTAPQMAVGLAGEQAGYAAAAVTQQNHFDEAAQRAETAWQADWIMRRLWAGDRPT